MCYRTADAARGALGGDWILAAISGELAEAERGTRRASFASGLDPAGQALSMTLWEFFLTGY